MLRHRFGGCSAEILGEEGLFTLTIRDQRGRLLRRRLFGDFGEAVDEMYRFLGERRAA